MAEIGIDELRSVLRRQPEWERWSQGEERSIYIRLGKEAVRAAQSHTMQTIEDYDVALDLDERGRVIGIEFV